MSKPTRIVPDYLIERLVKGELPEAQAAALRAELQSQPGGLERVQQQLAASDADIVAQHPPARIAAAIKQRAVQSAPTRAWALMWPTVAVAAAGALAVALYVRSPQGANHTGPQSLPVAEEVIGLKGMRPHLVVYRKHEGAPQRLSARDPVRPGDVLQLAYVVPAQAKSAQRPFGAIVSIDANRSATLHFPLDGGAASPLDTNGETRLPNAYELDASPGFERFVLVMSATPFSSSDVRDALAEGRPLPATFTKFEITLLKELP